MWIDTHCHPFSKPYKGESDAVLQRAREAGVSAFIVVGYDAEANKKAVALAEQHEDVWATAGVHPCDAAKLTDQLLDEMEIMARVGEVIAIGETGLDYHHMKDPKEVQEEAFRKQIDLAKRVGLPLVVHSRDAAEDTLRVLMEERAEKVIFHCYSYGYEFGKKVWEQGYYTSFSGVVTYPQAADVQEAAAKGPLDLFLIETDCPYLAPQSIRGKRNEMMHVVEVGEKIAELRGVEPKEIAEVTMENARELFDF